MKNQALEDEVRSLHGLNKSLERDKEEALSRFVVLTREDDEYNNSSNNNNKIVKKITF